MLQPYIPQQGIVTPLVEEQLSAMLQAGVHFTVLVEVGRVMPTAVLVVQEQDVAFSDIDEKTDVAAAAMNHEGMRSVSMANP